MLNSKFNSKEDSQLVHHLRYYISVIYVNLLIFHVYVTICKMYTLYNMCAMVIDYRKRKF